MTVIIPLPAIIGGITTALLYIAYSHGLIIGVTAPFLPLLTFALSGMMYGRAGVTAAFIAAAPLMLIGLDLSDMLLIYATQLIPAAILMRTLMVALIRKDPPAFVWAITRRQSLPAC